MRLVGPSTAKQILFTAGRFDAPTALRMGLVDEVVPKADLDDRVREVAEGMAANAPMTLRAVKLTVRELLRPEEQRDDEAVRAAVQACFDSDDHREGVAAFMEKRTPAFENR
jgi:enoyl-CoA hydratase/carnithine racemase